MNKKTLLAFLLCLTMLFPGCSKKNQINTKLEINGYPDAKEFEVYNPYNNENPLGKYLQDNGLKLPQTFEDSNVSKTRNIKIGKNNIEFNYLNSTKTIEWSKDIFAAKHNDSIKVVFYKDTDIISKIYSWDDSLESIFPYSGYNFDSEASYKSYCENIAKLLNFDISSLTYGAKTQIKKNDTVSSIQGYSTPQNDESLYSRSFYWSKEYDNEYSITSFLIEFKYDKDNVRLTSVEINSYPDKVFKLSSDEAKELVKAAFKGWNYVNLGTPQYLTILNYKFCIGVSVEYGEEMGSAATVVYIFPSDVTFP